ncbi:hypothetical protein ASG11_12875 [Sphingomonas sp. Leaf357]|uniref:winged helix DNA-binding protein n=1 Tax=Sphingomonas sp. Leaf357 TaxID=1736350 RepID=UPI0006F91A43|nr:winged helix DNA-binding protein [Sphingomonas sp. Leaf357]KQS05030.1 hypothetical protein ASG11_12875 [Sphingomonas sp. Leaf357]
MDSGSNDRLVGRIKALCTDLDAVAIELGNTRNIEAIPEEITPLALARRIAAGQEATAAFFDPALFVDPATNIVLRLFIDHQEDRGTTSGACCAAAGVPRTTALRWINLLSARGLLEMYERPSDRRSTMIRLTPSGLDTVGGWLLRMKAILYNTAT